MSSAAEMRTAWHRTAATCYLLNEDSKRNSPKQSGDFQWFKQDEFLKPKSLGDGWSSVHSHYFMDKKLDFHFHVENDGDSIVEVALGSGSVKSLESSEWQTIDSPSMNPLHEGTVSEKLASDLSPVMKVGMKNTVTESKLQQQQQPVASKSVEINSSQTVPKWRHANKGELAALIARKSSEDMGNCDLPPPSPAASRSSSNDRFDRRRLVSTHEEESGSGSGSLSSSAFHSAGSLDSRSRRSFMNPKESVSGEEDTRGWKSLEGESSGFLGEALCRSQTRAREAEKRAEEAVSEKEKVLNLFFREASLSRAYKHWIKFLEVENLWLRRRQRETEEELDEEEQQSKHQKPSSSKKKRKHLNSDHTVAVLGCTVGLAFALGVSLAGAGLVFGCTMGWILFAF